jgi:hypothetical protein
MDLILTKEVIDTANSMLSIMDNKDNTISLYELLDISVKIQYNRLYKEANVLCSNQPSALEKIAMEFSRMNDK